MQLNKIAYIKVEVYKLNWLFLKPIEYINILGEIIRSDCYYLNDSSYKRTFKKIYNSKKQLKKEIPNYKGILCNNLMRYHEIIQSYYDSNPNKIPDEIMVITYL